MITEVLKKKKNIAPDEEKYSHISPSFLDIYLPKRNNLIKYYILDPGVKLIN